MKKGILLIGHGTRREHGLAEFIRFFEAVKETVNSESTDLCVVRYAFLELQEPTIHQAVESFLADGVKDVVAIPLFLFSAGHMKEDIPALLHDVKKLHPDLSIWLDDSFGEDDVMLTVVRDRLFQSTLTTLDEDTFLMILGRGNKDSEAQGTFQKTAERIAVFLHHPQVDVGFLAGTGDSMEDVLSRAVSSGVRKFVIYPYLWFSGWLTDTLPERVKTWQSTHPAVDVSLAISPHLGLHPALIEVVARRVRDRMELRAGG